MTYTFLNTILLILLLIITPVLGFAKQITPDNAVKINLSTGTLSLQALNQNAIRVQFTQENSTLPEELIYSENISKPDFKIKEDKESLHLKLNQIGVTFDKRNQVLTFTDAKGKIILQEKAEGRIMRNSTIQGEPTFEVEQQFITPTDEYLYGTGQFQDGYLNIRGLTRRLTQVNTQIAIPFILSNKGYGLLWNNYGLTDFNPADQSVTLIPSDTDGQSITVDATSTTGNMRETRFFKSFTATIDVPAEGEYSLLLDVGQRMARQHYISIDGQNIIDINNLWLPPTTSAIVKIAKGKHTIEVQGVKSDKPILYWRKVTDVTTFRSPVAQALDYTVFSGSADEVIASYRELTGNATMMPLWALGYIHCRERYNTQSELLENAMEFRTRKIPIDVIVQDWQWWGKYGWNAMQFDEDKYPDPNEMTSKLHEMNIRLMLSVWSKIDKQSELGKQMLTKGYYIQGTDWIDFFNPNAAAYYWQNFSNKLLKPYKIDAWWQDATEPENDDLLGRRINNGRIPGELYRNIYPLFVSKTVYEGLRKDDPNRRAMILTRSGFSGLQRYAAVTWSGDVGNDWETFRRQITGGLGQMAAGLPWWTYDAGGFFRPSDQYTNTDYQERLLRWIQASTFLPIMRVHGYMSNTEPWRYGEQVEHIASQYLQLRYRLLPYIYSQSAMVSYLGSTLMRPLVFDFPNDKEALEQQSEYMFGTSLLINPVTESRVNQWKTYLPNHDAGWIDFWSGKKYKGGQYIDVPVSIEKIPVFVKAGSILFMDTDKQFASQKTDKPLEIHIYPGMNTSSTLYEDEGDNYNYEQGAYSTIKFHWDDAKQMLSIDKRHGEFPGMLENRTFRIVTPSTETFITYNGKQIQIQL
ncbi:DUF5110 domain-containing protein [Dysgonomonas sp. Marseille-P4677]|nr:DUF5110 domain-containing protein [Dysgonomonas sp. Marseille-P4677]